MSGNWNEQRNILLVELQTIGSVGRAEGESHDRLPLGFYPVPEHLRMLDPDVVLIVGPRGSGKTEIARVLTDAGLVTAVAQYAPAIRFPSEKTDWKKAYPLDREGFDVGGLRSFLKSAGADLNQLREFWFTYLVRVLKDELDADDSPGRHDLGEARLHGGVGAEAVDALPRRKADARHEALALQVAVREDVVVADREEVRLALEAEAGVDLGEGEAGARKDAAVVGLLPGARRQQVREVEGLLLDRKLGVHVREEARVRGVDEPGLQRVGRHHQHAHAEVAELVAQAMPLPDRELAVDAPARTEPGARVRVRAALHAEVRRVAHQHAALPAAEGGRGRRAHGRGIPGGSAAGSKPPACSRCDCGNEQ